MKRLLHIVIAIISLQPFSAGAEAPAGYYTSLTGKSGSALKTALYQIINPHTQVSSYNSLPEYFAGRRGAPATDVRPGTNYWWDMYSDMDVLTTIQFGTYMNREHSLPKSWWGGSTSIPAYVDLNHLYPAEAKANQAKSNYPLGEIAPGATPTFNNGITRVGTGINSGGAPYVFEPATEYKGDFARTYFYMVTCYQNMNWTNTWQVMNGVYPSLQQWTIDLLLKWHRADPVSQKEINRNEAVYQVQNNRNPFIDDPELAEYIWGNKKGQAYHPSGTVTPGEATLITPVHGMYLDFGQVALGHSVTANLIFRGENCSGQFELAITGGMNPSLFSFPSNPSKPQRATVAGSLANNAGGTYIPIKYTPTSTGTHSSQVMISDGGMPDGLTYKVYLKGECLPEPTLTKLTAIEPANVTSSSYTARWEAPAADEVVDYYMVTVKRYKDGVVTTTEYPAETDSLDIDGLDLGDYDTYAVQSVRLEVRSPMSNYITVRPTAAIDNILADEPFIVESHPGGLIRIRCSSPHTNLMVYDITGRLVMSMPEVTDLTEISLPVGAYLINTTQHRRPVKVIAR